MNSTSSGDQLLNSSIHAIGAENSIISASRWPAMALFVLIFIICSTTALIFIIQLYRKKPPKLECTSIRSKNDNGFKMNAKKEKMPIYMFPDSTLFGDSQLLLPLQKQEKRAIVDEELPLRSAREKTSEKTIKGPYKKRKKMVEEKFESALENQTANELLEDVWTSLSERGIGAKSASLSND